MQQPFANIVAFLKRCVALLPDFKENSAMYVLNDFRTHNIPVGKCSMLFPKIESILEALQHGFWKECHLADTLIETCVLPLNVQIRACKMCNMIVKKCTKSLL